MDVALDQHVHFDPAVDTDVEGFARAVPARWAVYLFADADDRPIQLLSVKNLRASLTRRLGGAEMLDAPSATRKVDYRQIVRRIYWRRVDSSFEADLVYLHAARSAFPSTYQAVASLRQTWFIQIDPDAAHPRYTKTNRLDGPGLRFGPLPDKHAAARLIERLEDWFDLCRYHDVLVKSPHGRACAYKEMGRCPAPCDGSISLEAYRQLVRLSVALLNDPSDFLRSQEARMRAAAAAMQFESAARIRQFVESLSVLRKPEFRHLRRLDELRFLSLQAGPVARAIKAFLVTPIEVALIWNGALPATDFQPLVREALTRAESVATPAGPEIDGGERLGVVSHHLFARQTGGVFILLDQLDERSVKSGLAELNRQRRRGGETPNDPGAEGVDKQLQAL